MADFHTLRQQLESARQQQREAADKAFLAREQVARLATRRDLLRRSLNPDDQAQAQALKELERAHRASADAARRESARVEQLRDTAFGLAAEFAKLNDPRQAINKLSDDLPFLLLPVRMETRFHHATSASVGTAAPIDRSQLWVRIFPDDCALDSFDPVLSETEITGAKQFWIDWWAAGGADPARRAAWRALVASHGAGRSIWIIEQFKPINAADEPTRDPASEILLVTITSNPLPTTEIEAAQKFWKAAWLAGDDVAALANARQTLEDETSPARAQVIIDEYRPANISLTPDASVPSRVVFLHVPPVNEGDLKRLSWAKPATTEVMPDRFVLLGFSGGRQVFEVVGNPIPQPLTMGPDPQAQEANRLRQENGEVIAPDELRWMFDFDRAVEWGLGFRIDLTAEQAVNGFDRIFAVGLRLSADADQAKEMMETLFDHHFYGRTGLSLIRQGTPTNNTEEENAGYQRSMTADDAFDFVFNRQTFTETDDDMTKSDGQWLAESLGICNDIVKKYPFADGMDQAQSRAMNAALWPGTLGYMMETLLDPVFSAADIEQTRRFFIRNVRGRGAVPALRVGRQPYGVLPVTAFSRMSWIDRDSDNDRAAAFRRRLYGLLRQMDGDWASMADHVSHIHQAGDPHRTLLDVIGLHPASMEFSQRYAQSLEQLFNQMNLEGLGGLFLQLIVALGLTVPPRDLLRRLGYTGSEEPDILKKYFRGEHHRLHGPVVDDRKLSESEPVRVYATGERNYITWLHDAATASFETLRQELEFTNGAPRALLYLMLRHALLQSYWHTSMVLQQALPDGAMGSVREPAFIHLATQAPISESRFAMLYRTDQRITGSTTQLLTDFIQEGVRTLPAAADLRDQIAGLALLEKVPTAALERLFAEHIDCCAYRYDAWLLGLVHHQLADMRARREPKDEDQSHRDGAYLGAYGWLEDVRPKAAQFTPVKLDPELDKVFSGTTPLMEESTNAGFIHAPSVNQAVTAAILRNGYLSNATPAAPNTLAVNLSSERVRMALAILEGVRQGQSLSALLGYQFERGLHDRNSFAEVDEFIFKIRKEFPLRADRLRTTRSEPDDPIEAVEARNVVDGLTLVEHMNSTGQTVYPWGRSLPSASSAQAAAINAEAERLRDSFDAVADLMMAESVHQVVQGNHDRAAASLNAVSRDAFPPEPQVVQTPRSGTTLTHRVALHVDTTAVAEPSWTPRAKAEPALNRWLNSMLPPASDVVCAVSIEDPITGTTTPQVVTLNVLGVQPLDLLHMGGLLAPQSWSALDDLIVRHVLATFTPRPDAKIHLHYTDPVPGQITLFELAALLRHLRGFLLRSRALRPGDMALQNEATSEEEGLMTADRGRMETAYDTLQAVHQDWVTFQTTLESKLGDAVRLHTEIDVILGEYVELAVRCNAFGLANTGWGFAYDWRSRVQSDMVAELQATIDRWNVRLTDYAVRSASYDALPAETPDEERYRLLRTIERLVSTEPILPSPQPADLRSQIEDKKVTFVSKLSELAALPELPVTTLSAHLAAVQAVLPLTSFDLEPFTATSFENSIVRFVADLHAKAVAVIAEVGLRLAAADSQFTAEATAPTAQAKLRAIEQAAAAIFGESFVIVPSFSVPEPHATELANTLTPTHQAQLLAHANSLAAPFPVDTWLYGAARVREKLHHLEQATLQIEGFGRSGPTLTPAQLPFKTGDFWLAVEYPNSYVIDSDRLLYTAHYSVPFQAGLPTGGLLLDEWTEVIPGTTETTGLTFHFDRPNSEPPQCFLLVTPASNQRVWQWADLVDALSETLTLARKRGVEPVHVDATPYAQFLPATVSATTVHPITIALNYSLNNDVLSRVTAVNLQETGES